MDQCVIDAVAAVPIGVDTADLWYGALCTSFDLSSVEWDDFAAELRSQAASMGFGSEITDGFVEYLETRDGDPLQTVREMCLYGPERLTAQHRQMCAQATEVDDVDDGYDVDAWLRFLPENGIAWNGDEVNWTAFTEWFHYEAAQVGLGTPAYEFVAYVESHPDRIAAFAEYGITIGVANAAEGAVVEEPALDIGSVPVLREGDSGEWVEYLDQMLASHGF